MKECTFCFQKKDLSDFTICKHAPDGRSAACKKCRNQKYYHRDKKRSLERNKKWVSENRERSRAIKKRYEENNKEKLSLAHRERRKRQRIEEPWVLFYKNIVARVTNRKRSYFRRGIKNKITVDEVKSLYFRDRAWELNQPSIDRIDSSGDYEFSNCRFIELKENQNRKKFRRKTKCVR